MAVTTSCSGLYPVVDNTSHNVVCVDIHYVNEADVLGDPDVMVKLIYFSFHISFNVLKATSPSFKQYILMAYTWQGTLRNKRKHTARIVGVPYIRH